MGTADERALSYNAAEVSCGAAATCKVERPNQLLKHNPQQLNMRKLVVAAVLLYAAGAIAMICLLSNWFRYSLSLEAMLVAAVIITGGTVVLTVGAIAFKRPSRALVIMLLVTVLGFCAWITAMHRSEFGTWIPPLQFHHVVTSGYATLATRGEMLRYGVELRDPFSSAHEEYLVVDWSGGKREIRLPIFDHAPSGYGGAAETRDWVVLLPTDNENVFVAQIGSYLSDKRFRVDISTGDVTVLQQVQ